MRLRGAVEKEKRRAGAADDSVNRDALAVNRMGSEPRKERRRLVPIRSHLILQEPPLRHQIPSGAASASAAIAALGRRRLRCGVDCFVAALLAMTSAGPSPAALRRGLLRRYAPRNDDRWAVAAALRRGLLRRYAPSNDDRWAVAGRNSAWIASSS